MIWTAVVVGTKLEAWIVRQPGIRVICGVNGLMFAGHTEVVRDCRGFISFGVAGGLAPNLRPGTWIVGSEILYGETRFATHKLWSKNILARMPNAIYGKIAGASTPIAQPEAKRALHIGTGAIAVDMESHIVANVAMAHGLPMVVARVIVDPAEHALPSAAVVSLCSNGTIDIATLMRLAIAYPREFPDLLRAALDALFAGTALIRGRQILDPRTAFADVRRHKTVAALETDNEYQLARPR